MSDFWDNVMLALALVMVFEGLLPFISPRMWRDTFRRLIELTDGQIRFMGLVSLLAGLLLCLLM